MFQKRKQNNRKGDNLVNTYNLVIKIWRKSNEEIRH